MTWYKYKYKQSDGTQTFGVVNLDTLCDISRTVIYDNEGKQFKALVMNFPFAIDKTKTIPLEYHKGGEVKKTQTKILKVPYGIVIEDQEDITNILNLLGVTEDVEPVMNNITDVEFEDAIVETKDAVPTS